MMVTSAGRLRNSTSSGSSKALVSRERPIQMPINAPNSMARTKAKITLRRVIFAFVLAMLLGALIGIWMGRSRLTNALLDPLLVLFLNLPALVTIILLYVWFGLVEMAAVLAVVINKVPNVAVTLREGARSL